MIAEARERGIPVVDNAEFATALATRHKPGDYIAPELFQMAAQVLVSVRTV